MSDFQIPEHTNSLITMDRIIHPRWCIIGKHGWWDFYGGVYGWTDIERIRKVILV